MGKPETRRTAGAFAILLLAACTSPDPRAGETGVGAAPAETPAAADTAGTTLLPQDSGFEGSMRVWLAARDRGVTFRAVGQEPGWLLEIEGDTRMKLVVNYGADEIVTAVPAPVQDSAGRTIYHAVEGSDDVRVVITEQQCSDTMSGERFDMTVEVTLNGSSYQGCGRSLENLQ